MKTIRLFVGIFFTNVKGRFKRDKGIFKKQHSNSAEMWRCKEYEL